MRLPLSVPFAAAALLAWTAPQAAPIAQVAQVTQVTESRIARVVVYPGSATVERVTRVAAGARSLSFACLPAGLDVQSLQVSADAAVRIGETSVLTEARALSSRCAGSALDGRIRELEDQKAALQAESEALGLVTGYLKGLSGPADDASSKRAASDAKNLVATADALLRTGQDALQKQHRLGRRQADIDRQLAPLVAERSRTQGGDGGSVVAVTVTLAATRMPRSGSATRSAGPAGRRPTVRRSTPRRARSASNGRRWSRRPPAKTGAA